MDPVFRALVLTTLVSTAAAFGFAVAYFRELDRRRIANIYFRRHAAQMLMDISKHWGELYHLRNELMASSLDVEDLRKEYGSDYARFLNSDEWKKMRELCHFFEMVGLCIHERLLNPDIVFVIVTVDDKNELLSKRLVPVIEYLREVYRPDLYLYYDKFLLPLYKRRQSRKNGHAGRAPGRHRF